MLITHVFQDGDGQALLIPQELRTDVEEYYISKIDDVFVAYPVQNDGKMC